MSACQCPEVWINGQSFTTFNQFFGSVFGECVYTPVQYVPAILGLTSLLAWMVALVPQLYINFKNKRCDAVSSMMIFIWLVADAFNFIGLVLLQHRLTAILLGAYFCINDLVMLAQMWYYSQPREGRSASRGGISISPLRSTIMFGVVSKTVFSFIVHGASFVYLIHAFSASSIPHTQLEELNDEHWCNPERNLTLFMLILGAVCSWISGALYFCSRMPQLLLNYRTKSVKGLSISSFVLAIFANATFGLQFIIANMVKSRQGAPFHALAFVREDLPFIIGSLGTIVYDVFIVYQSRLYRKQRVNTKHMELF